MSATILVVDDVDTAREAIAKSLRKDNYKVLEAATLQEARTCLNEDRVDICVLDVNLPDGSGLSLLDEVANMPWQPKFIVITAFGQIDAAVDAMKKGAMDFLTKPLKMQTLKQAITRAVEQVALRRELNQTRSDQTLSFVVGNTPLMQAVMNLARRAAETSVSILITG